MRRDYWLDICLEIFRTHKFIRKYNHKDIQKSEVLSRAILGIFRYRAVREAFQFSSSHYKTLLTFNLAETLPRGDVILETLSSHLTNLTTTVDKRNISGAIDTKKQLTWSPISVLALARLGFISPKATDINEQAVIDGDVRVGETNPLEVAVKKSISDTGRAQAAQATVDQVKVEGIDTNVAVMKVVYNFISFFSLLGKNSYFRYYYKSKRENKGKVKSKNSFNILEQIRISTASAL